MDENLKRPYQGHLIKFTNVVKGWQARWFILDPENGILQYYLNEGDKYDKARGGMHLAGAVISPSYEDSLTFTVSPADGDTYKLRAHDTKDRQMWINRLRIIAEMHTKAIGHQYPPLPPREHRIKDTTVSCGSTNLGGINVLDAFSQVAEILNETQRQHSALAQSIEELPTFGPGLRCIEPNVLLVKAMSQATLSCLDQCLSVLRSQHATLHHASHVVSQPILTTLPARGLTTFSPRLSPIVGRSPRSLRRNTTRSHRKRSKSPQPLMFSGSPSHHKSLPSFKSSTTPQSPSNVSFSPRKTSSGIYSISPPSSELNSSMAILESKKSLSASQSSLVRSENIKKNSISIEFTTAAADVKNEYSGSLSTCSSSNSTPKLISNSQDAYSSDTEISDTDDTLSENNDIEEGQRSVIMHIISQLRLGMDLTRVTLPTFILEKRSLLEMFADFLGHPDLFLGISFCNTPEERILAVVKWYLTSIHVGRHGSEAKKPYNPIIGETFFCSWRIPASSFEGSDADDNKYYSIKFRSEQVSHHPPVSAFFIECKEREMCINAHIWTKSKFMGMSVGVNLIGNITLFLGKASETYQLGMPSAYARSVLTEPWVELGGRINIHCPQTGFSAPVIFHTKPFYGGKLHKVTCEVKNSAGNVLCRVQGEWDSFLEFFYESNMEDEIINLKELGIIYRKRVRPIDKQAINESRNLWNDVTKALSLGDLTMATNHKKALEDRQRADEQKRNSAKAHFSTKLFRSYACDQWVYNALPNYADQLFSSKIES